MFQSLLQITQTMGFRFMKTFVAAYIFGWIYAKVATTYIKIAEGYRNEKLKEKIAERQFEEELMMLKRYPDLLDFVKSKITDLPNESMRLETPLNNV